ncbi:hypothetical protein RRG08_067152 [Elysia crispata]|uniref:Uncharacterized protein n=1 Tax=Elysia crispata TaxID=231223 RepID=A0AAE1AP04_9GAST|nr:hypothetical protein RRG08_067152 [Elysia crispata]
MSECIGRTQAYNYAVMKLVNRHVAHLVYQYITTHSVIPRLQSHGRTVYHIPPGSYRYGGPLAQQNWPSVQQKSSGRWLATVGGDQRNRRCASPLRLV